MKIGQVYRYEESIIIPLSNVNLDNQVLILKFQFTADAWADNPKQPIINASILAQQKSSILTTKMANDLINSGMIGTYKFEILTLNNTIKAKIKDTYVPTMDMPLGVGDKYSENKAGVSKEYTVLGFFAKEVAVDPAKLNSAKTKRLFAYGVNLTSLLQYVANAENTKVGIKVFFTDQNLSKPIVPSIIATLKDLWQVNSNLPFWSINMPRPSTVVYIKQPKPVVEPKPIVFKQPVVQGDRQTDLQFMDGWDNAKYFSYLKQNGIVNDGDDMLFIERNFVSPTYPDFPTTGNIFFDDMVIVQTNNSFQDSRSYLPYDNNSIYFSFKSILKAAGRNYTVGDVSIGSGNTPILSSYKIIGNLNIIITELDYTLITAVLTDKDTNLSLSPSASYGYVIHTPIYYLGQGLFSCLQKENTATDKFGVGDTFEFEYSNTVKAKYVILYSYYGYNKKGQKIKLHTIADYEHLVRERDKNGNNAEPISIYCVTDETLHKEATDHTSYYDVRQAIKNYFLTAQGSTLQATPISPYQDLKDALGQDFDDEFLSGVANLDWNKIKELQKQQPNILEPMKQIIQDAYVDYLIEKAQNTKPLVKSSTKIGTGKFFYKSDTASDYMKVVEQVESKVGDEIAKSAALYSQTAAPNIQISKIPEFFNKLVQVPEEKYFSQDADFYFTFQENKEPIVIQKYSYEVRNSGDPYIRARIGGTTSITDNFSDYVSHTATNGFKADGDYYRVWYGYYYMYMLWTIHCIQNIRPELIKTSKYKQIFPIKPTDYFISKLKYMNRWGFFTTPEIMYDELKKIIGGYSYMNYEFYGNNIKQLFVSQSASVVLGDKQKAEYIVNAALSNKAIITSEFFADRQRVVDFFKSLPIDWGNTDAPYMDTSAALPPVTTTTKTKRSTKAQNKINVDWKKGEFSTELWSDIGIIMSPTTIDDLRNNYQFGITAVEYPDKQAQPTDMRAIILLNFSNSNFDRLKEIAKETFDSMYGMTYVNNVLAAKYAGIKEHVILNAADNMMTISLPKTEILDYFRALWDNLKKELNIQSTTTTAPPTPTPPPPTQTGFQWITQGWMSYLLPSAIQEFRNKYSLDNDFDIQYCNFAYNGLGYYMIRFMPSQKGNVAYNDLIDEIEVFEGTIKYKANLTTIPELQDKLTDSANADVVIFIPTEETYMLDFTDILLDTKGTTTTPATKTFTWTSNEEDWGTPNAIKEFKQAYDISQNDFKITFRYFEINDNGKVESYILYSFSPDIYKTGRSDKYAKLIYDMTFKVVNEYGMAGMKDEYPELNIATIKPDLDATFIVPTDKLPDFGKFLLPTMTTPPAPTTTPLTDIPEDYWEDVKATIPSIDSEEEFERILSKQRKTKEDKAAIANLFYDFYKIDSGSPYFDELVNSGLAEKGKRIYRYKLKEGYDKVYFTFFALYQNTILDLKSWIDDVVYSNLNDDIKEIMLQKGMPYLRQIVAQVNGFTPKPAPPAPKQTKPTKTQKTTTKTAKPKKPTKVDKAIEDLKNLDFDF